MGTTKHTHAPKGLSDECLHMPGGFKSYFFTFSSTLLFNFFKFAYLQPQTM